MKAIDRDTLLRLAGHSMWPSVSLYLPCDRTGLHADADRIRLRNMVRRATERLVADEVKPGTAESVMAAALALAGNDKLWGGGSSGLAIFVSPGGTEPIWLDIDMPELVVVGDRFYLRPAYAAYMGERKAWALAIDSNKTRLFRLDPHSIEEVTLPEGTPLSLADETRLDQREESLQFHAVSTMAGGRGPHGGAAVTFHGHGGEKDYDKRARERFMGNLGKGVLEVIGAECTDPLVLLGVDYMVDDFRATMAYPHVARAAVSGATDEISAAEVHKLALAALQPGMEAAGAAAVAEYEAAAASGRASSDPAEIVAAAAGGRVKTLVMDDASGPWGWFDRATYDVTHLCKVEPRKLRDAAGTEAEPDIFECGWDLIDLAAAETLGHGGTVLAFRGEKAPVTGAVAVFRY